MDPGQQSTPGGNVLIAARTDHLFSDQPNDTLIIRPTGIAAIKSMPEGEYLVIVERGVAVAHTTKRNGAAYFQFFRVGEDMLPLSVVAASPRCSSSFAADTGERTVRNASRFGGVIRPNVV